MSSSSLGPLVVPSNIRTISQLNMIKEYIDKYTVCTRLPAGQSFQGTEKFEYVPLDVIERVATAGNASAIVKQDNSTEWASEASKKAFTDACSKEVKGIFAFSAHSYHGVFFAYSMFSEQHYDRQFPDKHLDIMDSVQPRERKAMRDFKNNQYKFYPPVFEIGSFNRFFYDVTSLPFTKLEFVEDDARGKSRLYKVSIHERHIVEYRTTKVRLEYQMREFEDGKRVAEQHHCWMDRMFGFFYGSVYMLCY